MIKYHEFETIRLRSSTAEALSLYLINNFNNERTKEILEVLQKTCDVIEHIAQYSIEDVSQKNRAEILTNALDSLLYILNKYEVELQSVRLNIPSIKKVTDLKMDIIDNHL